MWAVGYWLHFHFRSHHTTPHRKSTTHRAPYSSLSINQSPILTIILLFARVFRQLKCTQRQRLAFALSPRWCFAPQLQYSSGGRHLHVTTRSSSSPSAAMRPHAIDAFRCSSKPLLRWWLPRRIILIPLMSPNDPPGGSSRRHSLSSSKSKDVTFEGTRG